MDSKFPKSERLNHKKVISQLFQSGQTSFSYPFRLVFATHPEPSDIKPQILISIPKKKFKKAVDRNWLKRRIKEAYRQNKIILTDKNAQFQIRHLIIIYIATEKMPYGDLKKKLLKALNRLENH